MRVNWSGLWTSVKHASPQILTGIGIAGMATAGVMAVKVTPKAMDAIELEAFNMGVTKEELSFADKFRVVWKYYIWPVGTAIVGAGCIIASDIEMAKRINNLSALLASTEGSLMALSDKAVNVLGQEKVDEIKKEVAKESIQEREAAGTMQRIPDGYFLCVDGLTGQEFISNENEIYAHQNNLNKLLNEDEEISVDDYTHEFGLREVADGNRRVWELDGARGKGLIDIRLQTDWANDMKTPAIFLQHRTLPHERRRSY